MKSHHLLKLAGLLLCGCWPVLDSSADILSVNFNNTTDAPWVLQSGQTAGPLGSDNWNNTSTPAGTLNGLVDTNGNFTSANLTWSSTNNWTNGDGNTTGNHILIHPYLDDGGAGVSVSVTNIPFAQYFVYGMLSSDQDGETGIYTSVDFNVNGTWVFGGTDPGTNDAFGTWRGAAGEQWVQAINNNRGNYWISGLQTSSTLTLQGQSRNGPQRGSLAGIMVVNAIPEPGSLTLLGCIAAWTWGTRRRK